MRTTLRSVLMLCLFALILAESNRSWAQTTPIDGIRKNTPAVHALTNARIVQGPGRVVEGGTIVLRDGIIEEVGVGISIPADAKIQDYDGMTVYPGFIESYSNIGFPTQTRDRPADNAPRSAANTPPAPAGDYWNPRVHPEHKASELSKPKTKDLEALRKLGFTSALVVPQRGVFRGSSVLVNLSDGLLTDHVLKEDLAQHIAYERRDFRSRGYPGSLMGAIALIKQAILDAQWYAAANKAYDMSPVGQTRPEESAPLEALSGAVGRKVPFVFEVDDDLNFMRSKKIADEFGLTMWMRGSGYEYRIVEQLKSSGIPLILPVNFPKAPDVDVPEAALSVSLEQLNHWDLAPATPGMLNKAGVPFALTASSLEKISDFHKKVADAIDRGLSGDAALAAITTTPAAMFGVDRLLGTIDAGKIAHLVVTDGELFGKKTKIMDVWVEGNRFEITKKPQVDPRGEWLATLDLTTPLSLEMSLTGEVDKLSGNVKLDTTKIKLQKISLKHRRINLVFPGKALDVEGVIRLSGYVKNKAMSGQGQDASGNWFTWRADWQGPVKETKKKKPEDSPKVAQTDTPVFLSGAYSAKAVPEQPKHVLVKGGTIWTSGSQGKLEDTDLLVTNGKIAKIGKDLKAPKDAVVVDAKGKHVSPGLIDAHSHTGISQGVNESSQAVTAEVGVKDVINNNDIGFYRELAGGLTAVNQLHGSANPIGGRNAVVKLRWGASPDGMLIEDAIPGIKFALGENVKQSNRPTSTTRYPQTRMGVEQIIRDRFKAAQDYEAEWKAYEATKKKQGIIPPRRDLELETLVEILHGKRLVHSHSYRQDEILMLVRIADDFGFTIGTFQHVLEGYKVADALAKHGAGASTFSDWWAYKFEVYDAIPYNGALMHNAGVVVTFNSDSGELARRMNLEAAKAVRYGGVSESEALKFVTLNAAKQLRVDHRIGSLEVGKDADFTIWNGSPLSTYTKCEQTWIDGRKYFDLEEDQKLREQIRKERARLIQKVLSSAQKEEPARNGKRGPRPTTATPN